MKKTVAFKKTKANQELFLTKNSRNLNGKTCRLCGSGFKDGEKVFRCALAGQYSYVTWAAHVPCLVQLLETEGHPLDTGRSEAIIREEWEKYRNALKERYVGSGTTNRNRKTTRARKAPGPPDNSK